VRYEAVNAMLLNEFIKAHRKVQELETAIARQQKDITALGARLKALQIRKLNGQLRKFASPTHGWRPTIGKADLGARIHFAQR
jgi:hypothetical protein